MLLRAHHAGTIPGGRILPRFYLRVEECQRGCAASRVALWTASQTTDEGATATNTRRGGGRVDYALWSEVRRGQPDGMGVPGVCVCDAFPPTVLVRGVRGQTDQLVRLVDDSRP